MLESYAGGKRPSNMGMEHYSGLPVSATYSTTNHTKNIPGERHQKTMPVAGSGWPHPKENNVLCSDQMKIFG